MHKPIIIKGGPSGQMEQTATSSSISLADIELIVTKIHANDANCMNTTTQFRLYKYITEVAARIGVRLD